MTCLNFSVRKLYQVIFAFFPVCFPVFARHIACYALLSETEKHSQTQLLKKDCAKLKTGSERFCRSVQERISKEKGIFVK